jgi:hypothetical protein
MKATLDRELPRYGLDYETVDVDEQPALCRTWGDWVPVLLDGDRELARVRLAPGELEGLLAAPQGEAASPIRES